MTPPIEPIGLLVTCEHGGNRVPSAYRPWFEHAGKALASHRGFDAGALTMARTLARTLKDAELVFSTVSRLVVELNRSLRHRDLFSNFTRAAPRAVRAEIFARYYAPYWATVENRIERALQHHRRVVHIGSHSFTPVLDGDVRDADLGLLYDPRRAREALLCALWRDALRRRVPGWRVRRNYPYRGASDGLTTELRRRFQPSRYLGVELEINQRHPLAGGPGWRAMRRTIAIALGEALETFDRSAPASTSGTLSPKARSNVGSPLPFASSRR